MAGFFLTVGMVCWFHGYDYRVIVVGFLLVLLTMVQW